MVLEIKGKNINKQLYIVCYYAQIIIATYIHRLLIALAAVCADWEVECECIEDFRPPRLKVQLDEGYQIDVALIMEVIQTGSKNSCLWNINQLNQLADIYQGQKIK